VGTLTDDTVYPLDVPLTTTIAELKERVHALLGYDVDQQRLVWNGRQLESGTLASNGVARGDKLVALLRLRGC